jgi:hypothetical protein
MPKLPVRGAGIAPPALTDVLTSAAGYAADEKSAATSSLSDLMGGTITICGHLRRPHWL